MPAYTRRPQTVEDLTGGLAVVTQLGDETVVLFVHPTAADACRSSIVKFRHGNSYDSPDEDGQGQGGDQVIGAGYDRLSRA